MASAFVDADLVSVASGVVREGLLELVGQPEVIDHQAAGLVAKHAVDSGNGLDQAVAAHQVNYKHFVHMKRL